ncbi:VOC family protein [Ornithinimicrobium tianjinense]|uniref:VOC family protein n=1 Tax=Ornithinimicrobium tianjinense TaxID=1195761 RepID=A0A917F9R4_9MICO|nr:VOC family protein [Ornithinimicrobium tianjinense]GGF55949.1 VOC family protein [Ornithinimicrobium tianjinense]
MATLSTYMAFLGNAAEAFTHYQEVFGGELLLMRYSDVPQMTGMPFEPDPQAVAHAQLDVDGGRITGGDAMPGEEYAVRDTVYSLLYSRDDVERARELIDALVAGGGSMNMPFALAPWGSHYGQVFDRFGVMWSFDVAASAGEDG